MSYPMDSQQGARRAVMATDEMYRVAAEIVDRNDRDVVDAILDIVNLRYISEPRCQANLFNIVCRRPEHDGDALHVSRTNDDQTLVKWRSIT